jgi:hypothetical protein
MPPSRPPARFDERSNRLRVRIVADFVLHFRAVASGVRDSGADLDRLHGLNGHDRAREHGVELFVPLRVAAQARRKPRATTSKIPPTESPARSTWSTSAFIFASVPGSTQRSGDSRFSQIATISSQVASRSRRAWPTAIVWLSTRRRTRAEEASQGAGRDARGRLAGRGALQDVTRVVKIEFLRAGRSAWPGRGAVRRRCASSAPSLSSTGSAFSQFFQSRFSMRSAMGAPIVLPWRTPARKSA